MYLDIILPTLIAFAISAIIGPVIIPFLKKIKFGQTIRNEGPQTHLKKTGTPVMGGFIFLISILITSLIFYKEHPMILPVLLVTLGYGFVGFMDDYIKVVLKRSMGLRAWQKMLGQIVVTAAFAIYMVYFSGVSLALKIPFYQGHLIEIGWFAIPLLFFIALGTVNGTNFTDGLDGLLSSVTLAVALFFAVVSY
ncbi:MAG: phospho-N-acetylmuramoyl-pentapeptide-transferase, partial [Clostridiales bacterium]|nr:phospho-N-acetylmuramoyl-pentapeptide-transferase [Clostridiales bacterium]